LYLSVKNKLPKYLQSIICTLFSKTLFEFSLFAQQNGPFSAQKGREKFTSSLSTNWLTYLYLSVKNKLPKYLQSIICTLFSKTLFEFSLFAQQKGPFSAQKGREKFTSLLSTNWL